MGFIICPDGTSVVNDHVVGSVLFEILVEDIQKNQRTDKYRIECILALGDVGLFNHSKMICNYLSKLKQSCEINSIKDACQDVLIKHKPKRKRTKIGF